MRTNLKKNNTTLLFIGIALVAFLLGLFGNSLLAETSGSLSGAAGALADKAACNTSRLASANPTGIVLADPLNLRTGPGLNYAVIATLEICTPVSLDGRNSDSTWIQVSLPGNLGGWVFTGYKDFPYINANVALSTLDVTTASGGPLPSGANTGSGNVSVIIQGGQVAAFVSGMPANTIVSATLTSSDGSKSLAVASGQSDAGGNITLTFPMPTKWADGTAVKSGTMTMTLTGGGTTKTATVTYYTY
jgi:uncharacterized protein YraI